ncbi:MAG: hypothetical protein A3A30_00440 [Candidatus Terrybacteria bacterium RIFCSPLOWO2_01_FULL_48_14]|nr:MAG: hypothetical protein A3A30_00440 [Candidatus Terrybacteria bacterium RIFCSPLOWO2_01_FULL_48_14]
MPDDEILEFATPHSKAPSIPYYEHEMVPHEFMLQCTACGVQIFPEGRIRNKNTWLEFVEFEHTRGVRMTPNLKFIHEGVLHYAECLQRVEGARRPIYVRAKTPVSSGCGGTMRLWPLSQWAKDVVAKALLRVAPKSKAGPDEWRSNPRFYGLTLG